MSGRIAPIRGLALSLLLLGVTAFWGWTFVVIKDVVTGPQACPVMNFLFWRFLIAAITLAPLAWRGITRRTWRAGGTVGLALAGGYILQTQGLRWTTPTNSALLTGLFVVFAALWDRVLYGRRTGGRLLATVLLSVVGLGLLVGDAPASMRAGDALTVLAAACYGLHIAWLSRHAPEHDAFALTLVQLLTVAGVSGILLPLDGPLHLPPPAAWSAILLTAVFASALAFVVQTYVQRRLSAVRTAVILTAEPVFGALFGCLLAGDRFGPRQGTGAVLIVGAVMMNEVWPTVCGRKESLCSSI